MFVPHVVGKEWTMRKRPVDTCPKCDAVTPPKHGPMTYQPCCLLYTYKCKECGKWWQNEHTLSGPTEGITTNKYNNKKDQITNIRTTEISIIIKTSDVWKELCIFFKPYNFPAYIEE